MSDVGGEFTENCGFEGKILCEVPQGAHGCDSRDTCDTPATGYTPPEGWRVLAVGEVLQPGDVWVNHEGESRPTKRVGERVNDELYIRCDPIEPEPQPEPQPPVPQDADQMIRLLSEANHNHVAMIGRLQARINDLETINAATTAAFDRANKANDTNVETIGKMQRELQQQHRELQKREVRIFDLDTINTAQEKALDAANKANDDLQHRLNVVSAEWAEQAETLRKQLDAATAELQKRHPDHVGRAISTDEWMDQFARDASVSRLQADRNDLAGKVVSLREQLQLANDRLAFLETLQPIAAACHTAQTMVRDMLGHMRCLLALQHTTDRSNFCALLESILEVFDDAECDEDEDDDTTCTSEAGQG